MVAQQTNTSRKVSYNQTFYLKKLKKKQNKLKVIRIKKQKSMKMKSEKKKINETKTSLKRSIKFSKTDERENT